MPENNNRSWVEPGKMTTREECEKSDQRGRIQHLLLRSRDVYIDLLTDSGTSAMSDRQWAGMMMGDEAYAGSDNFYHLEETIQKYYGYDHVGAESVEAVYQQRKDITGLQFDYEPE
jgi:tyrosine phenol-lyase